jgi:hypothetical protein
VVASVAVWVVEVVKGWVVVEVVKGWVVVVVVSCAVVVWVAVADVCWAVVVKPGRIRRLGVSMESKNKNAAGELLPSCHWRRNATARDSPEPTFNVSADMATENCVGATDCMSGVNELEDEINAPDWSTTPNSTLYCVGASMILIQTVAVHVPARKVCPVEKATDFQT